MSQAIHLHAMYPLLLGIISPPLLSATLFSISYSSYSRYHQLLSLLLSTLSTTIYSPLMLFREDTASYCSFLSRIDCHCCDHLHQEDTAPDCCDHLHREDTTPDCSPLSHTDCCGQLHDGCSNSVSIVAICDCTCYVCT